MSFDMNTALQVCTATLSKRAKTRSNAYVLYYANDADKAKGRYTGKLYGVTRRECKEQLEILDREYPYAMLCEVEGDKLVQFYTPANKHRDKKSGKLKFANVMKPKTA